MGRACGTIPRRTYGECIHVNDINPLYELACTSRDVPLVPQHILTLHSALHAHTPIRVSPYNLDTIYSIPPVLNYSIKLTKILHYRLDNMQPHDRTSSITTYFNRLS